MNTINRLLLVSVAACVSLSTAYATDVSVYSFPISADTQLNMHRQPAQVISQEYWFDVSGSALQKGVPLNNTAPGALVLISQKQGTGDGALLDVQQLNLLSEAGKPLLSKKVSESQLAQTGIFAKSVALQAQEGKNVGALMLKSNQSLSADMQYRVMVKEPHSPYSLRLKADAQSISAESKNLVSASLSFDQVNLSKSQMQNLQYQAELQGADGSVIPVTVVQEQESVTFNVEDISQALPPKYGLYEMQITAKSQVNGVNLQRNAKIALAISQPTAALENVLLVQDKQPSALVDVMINRPGRYEIRAVLYATDQHGEWVPVMETHAAKEANAGLERISIPFDQDILAKSGLRAPYQMRHVRLFDQGQLALLEESEQVVNLDIAGRLNRDDFKRD